MHDLKGSLLFLQIFILINISNGWLWTCNTADQQCKRIAESNLTLGQFPSLELCQLACNPMGLLWPQPLQQEFSKNVTKFNSEISFTNKAKGNAFGYLQNTIVYFNNIINYDEIINCNDNVNKVYVELNANSENITLDWTTDESYSLEINTKDNAVNVKITSNSAFGVRHGLETLLQLIVPFHQNKQQCLAIVASATIIDKPVFKHRGLLLDSARNFLSIDMIKKNIDGMAASKMNALHWHVTDTQSFPLELPSLPNMTVYGAYSDDRVYHPEQVKDLIEYAKLRGIRVIIEIDGPSHTGSGWEWGPEQGFGNLVVCANAQPWRDYCIQPPCGQQNPSNPNLYKVLKTLFGDVTKFTPQTEVFHMGGDEVFIPCWNSTPEIIQYLNGKPRTEETFLNLWSEHQKKVLDAFDSAVGNHDTKIIVWSSHLTAPEYIEKYLSNERYIIQTWVPSTDSLPEELLSKGYKLIISTKDAWYLDHGFWGTTLYHNWRTVYDNVILKGEGIYGGEVCLWGEYTDDNNVIQKAWPRAAAAAERLWSDPSSTSANAESRFYLHRERLVKRGIHAEALTPQWCVQSQGECI